MKIPFQNTKQNQEELENYAKVLLFFDIFLLIIHNNDKMNYKEKMRWIMENTMVFRVDELENYMITETLSHVNNALNEKGYNGINQIVGYLMSGDLGYISS